MISDEDSDEISLKDDSTGLPILLLGAEEPIPKYEHVLVLSRIATGRKRSGTVCSSQEHRTAVDERGRNVSTSDDDVHSPILSESGSEGEVQESGTVTPLLPANETVADGDDTNPPWEFADDLNDASDVVVSSEVRLRKIVNEHYKECLHVVVGYDLINISDSLNDVDPFQVIPGAGPEHAYVKELPVVSQLPFSAAELTLVKPKDKPFAVVACDRKGFVCYQCSIGKHSCFHNSSLPAYLKIHTESIPDFVLEFVDKCNQLSQSCIKSKFVKPLSQGRIAWCTTERQKRIDTLSSQTMENVLDDGSMALLPRDHNCIVCNGEMSIVRKFDTSSKQLLLWANVIKVTDDFS
eukprot:gene10370-11450_t